MKDKKLRLEQCLYRWLDSVDEVEEDISSLIDGHNISKSKIMVDINTAKNKLTYLESILKMLK